MRISNYLKFIIVFFCLASCSTENTSAENSTDDEIQNPSEEFTPTIWTKGAGTVANPFQIETPEHLFYLAEIVNDTLLSSVNPLGGRSFKVMSDIDLKSMPFTPIGGLKKDFVFHGNFDGNDKNIMNLCIDNPNKNYVGLFGQTGSNSSLININIKSGKIVAKDYVGGIVGNSRSQKILNCCFEGTIAAKNYVGGIIGRTTYNQNSTLIENSCFKGTIKGVEYVGGISGFNHFETIIRNCWSEEANISGDNKVGGISGLLTTNCLIEKSFSSASLFGTHSVGGIVGHGDSFKINECHFEGDIEGSRYNGGVIGHSRNNEIVKCYNSGSIKGRSETGGIAGYAHSGTIISSFNKGAITSTFFGGGIVGYSISSNTTQIYIVNCYNVGDIDGGKQAGGIVGAAYTADLKYCYSTADIPYVPDTSQPILVDNGFSTTVRDLYCYYLSDVARHITGSNKTYDEMQSQTFVDLLNSNTNNAWKSDSNTNLNKGFPVLNWQ